MAVADTSKSPVHFMERRIAAAGAGASSTRPPITGVAVSDAGIHAALVLLGYITA